MRRGPKPVLSEARAEQVCMLLMEQPRTRDELCGELEITAPLFRDLLRYIRNDYAPRFGLAIPRPTYEDGYRFRLTGTWTNDDPDDPAIKDGHRVQVVDSDARTRSTIRDLKIALANQPDKRAKQAKEIKSRLDVLVGIKAHTELLIELNQRDLNELVEPA